MKEGCVLQSQGIAEIVNGEPIIDEAIITETLKPDRQTVLNNLIYIAGNHCQRETCICKQKLESI